MTKLPSQQPYPVAETVAAPAVEPSGAPATEPITDPAVEASVASTTEPIAVPTAEASAVSTAEPGSSVADVLARPAIERLREYKYRCAQCLVFGLPVLALHYFGNALGGADAGRWSGILQSLLAGWALHVGASGMLFEGLLLMVMRRKLSGDFLAAVLAVGFYGYSLISVLHVIGTGRLWYQPLLFHWSIIVLVLWTGFRARQMSRSSHD